MASVRMPRFAVRNDSPAAPRGAEQPQLKVMIASSLCLAALLAGCAEGGSASEGDFVPQDASVDTSVGPEAGKDAPADGLQDHEAAEADALPDAAPDVPIDVPGDGECATGQKLCEGVCVPTSDPANGCASSSCDPCDLANATAKCEVTGCVIASCKPGFADCNHDAVDGCEVDTANSTDNCGACGDKCVISHAVANCVAGTCGIANCETGFDNCDFEQTNGCEVNLKTDPLHCGKCGSQCPTGTTACVDGVCKAVACAGNLGDCDLTPGCETDLSTSLQHCGACGNPCALPNAVPVCQDKACRVASCFDGYANCDGDHANGCEVHITESTTHCGACGADCSTVNNSSPACHSGLCTYTCDPGFADCNGPQPGVSDDGCETPVGADIFNCGACGLKCSNNNGSPSCLAGICSIACAQGFKNCNANAADGCEINSTNDVNNCGNCEFGCSNPHGSTACVNSLCAPSCDPGWKSCDNIAANGCEQDVSGDANNCGGCGVKCQAVNGSNACVSSACKPVCNSGFASCNSDPNDGCEANLNTDELNCGVCGKACIPGTNMQADCNLGVCSYTCSAGFWDIDKNPANGCEYACTISNAGEEICDQLDNDCDGTVDDGFDKLNDPNNCGNTCQKCGSSTVVGLCCNGTCRDASATNCGACDQACSPGMLVVSEVMANPASTNAIETPWEWFELYNPGTKAIDIRGFTIKDDGLDSHVININLVSPVIVPAGGYQVLSGGDTATNGANVGYVYSGYSLKNGADEVVIVAFGVEIDRVNYTTQFNTVGYSWELAKNLLSATSNDSMTNWCKASSTSLFHTSPAPDLWKDYGTPGSPNVCSK